MKSVVLFPSLFILLDLAHCGSLPNNTYNVPLLDFTDNSVNKFLLCSTPKCCPIALTFDDGPDGARGATDAIIDYLYSNNIPATFFINSENCVNVNTDRIAQQSIKNIVQYGFNLGTHTVHHKNLSQLTPTDIQTEIAGVQTALNTFMSPSPQLSLFRAPYGNPYWLGTQDQMNVVSKIVADAGHFHVGWQINPGDYACSNNISCITDPVFKAIDDGRWGIILMHCIFRNTANALPSLIAGLRERQCEFFTVEQIIQAKYGKRSAEVMADYLSCSKIPLSLDNTACSP